MNISNDKVYLKKHIANGKAGTKMIEVESEHTKQLIERKE